MSSGQEMTNIEPKKNIAYINILKYNIFLILFIYLFDYFFIFYLNLILNLFIEI